MGCGRSRHRSPSQQPDGPYKDKESLKENAKDSKRGGKKQKQADKQAAKAVIKREADGPRNSPRKATNGKTGELHADRAVGGATDKKDGAGRRDWQLEEAIDPPPETAVAVYRSSVPSSARASLKTAPTSQDSTNPYSSNGSVLNGGSQKAPASAQEIETQMEIPDKTPNKDKSSSGNSKPVHITSSQLEFFKMLDERIEKGADYDSDDE